MPNYGYHLARAQARLVRQTYRSVLPFVVSRPVVPRATFPIEVFAYSGEAALPEQVASIRSFLRFAGRPPRFTVVSDGTYSRRSIHLLEQLDPSVCVSPSSDWIPTGMPEAMQSYLTTHSTGRQLALIMSLPKQGPALYVDSDVLFCAEADDLARIAQSKDVPALYLLDAKFSGDERLFRDGGELELSPVNTGFLFLFKQLDWSLSVRRFLELKDRPNFFTNQTMTHLTMHANGAAPLDPRKYVLQLDDQFVYPDRYASRDIAMRHYVNPVRHKFWTTFARGR